MKSLCDNKCYKFVFITNLINHHQIPVADELYKIYGDDYIYIALEPLPDWLSANGYAYIDRPYVLKVYEGVYSQNYINNIINNADVVMIGAAPKNLVKQRQEQNKITFHYSERWFKDGYYHLLSPRLWKIRYNDYVKYRNKRSYMLCASAFTAPDTRKMFCFPKKCFKWGYFTYVPELDIKKILEAQKSASRLKILWIARFLILKHPELPVKLARMLKDRGIDFELNMYGNGVLFDDISAMINELDVSDKVNLCGNLPNEKMLYVMREHHILLFTSDRNEGWGAVVGEAMSNGCAVIGSDSVGSVPFLITDGVNGLEFHCNDLKDLYNKVISLYDNESLRANLIINAYESMKKYWSPKNAAESIVNLIAYIKSGDVSLIPHSGPCSIAR